MSQNKQSIPADGLAGLKENLTKDAISGFLVFLLALPLSLGIAKASDFPAIFGIVTAIIGGVVVSFFAGSRLTIKGPAAGLIVICSGAVAAFGGSTAENGFLGWHLALGAIVVASVIQTLFGVFKLGKVADFFPTAAIHGMLAAIGIIIMSKQIHTLLGIDPKMLKGKEPLELLAMIPSSIMHENAHITEIGLTCLAIMIVFSLIKHPLLKKIPAPLIVLLVSIPMGIYLNVIHENEVAAFALVKVGSIFESFKNGLFNVSFQGISTNLPAFIQYVVLFALIGSLESLLTAKAIDNLDPYERKSDFNKDLVAVGIGNIISGLLGGLPMISEVARSSANVANGGQTRWANFFHGLFLLIAVLVAVPIIEMIPSAALAAMLIFVGFRLAHPREFAHMFHIGKEQFAVFVTTVIVTLSTDLLIGVGSGILLEMAINLFNGLKAKNLFSADFDITEHDFVHYSAKAKSGLVFSNIISAQKAYDMLPRGKNITIDLSEANIIDHTAMTGLQKFVKDYNSDGGIAQLVGLDAHTTLGHDVASTHLLSVA
jgi:MFS superfamily sulfate permease-like transporter